MSGRPLTPAQRWEIATAEGLQKVVADRYGVSQAHVSRLRNGKNPIRVTATDVTNAALITLAFTGAA